MTRSIPNPGSRNHSCKRSLGEKSHNTSAAVSGGCARPHTYIRVSISSLPQKANTSNLGLPFFVFSACAIIRLGHPTSNLLPNCKMQQFFPHLFPTDGRQDKGKDRLSPPFTFQHLASASRVLNKCVQNGCMKAGQIKGWRSQGCELMPV